MSLNESTNFSFVMLIKLLNKNPILIQYITEQEMGEENKQILTSKVSFEARIFE